MNFSRGAGSSRQFSGSSLCALLLLRETPVNKH